MDFIHECIEILVNEEIIKIRVKEVEGEIDSLFNFYSLKSSPDEDESDSDVEKPWWNDEVEEVFSDDDGNGGSPENGNSNGHNGNLNSHNGNLPFLDRHCADLSSEGIPDTVSNEGSSSINVNLDVNDKNHMPVPTVALAVGPG